MENISLDESVNVILTPQFYTVKKEELPIKYLYQAKKIDPVGESDFQHLLKMERWGRTFTFSGYALILLLVLTEFFYGALPGWIDHFLPSHKCLYHLA